MQRHPEEGAREQASNIASRLVSMLRSWRGKQAIVMPHLVQAGDQDDYDADGANSHDNVDDPGHHIDILTSASLSLPSELEAEVRRLVCSRDLVDTEVEMRHAEAHEAIEGVRSSVQSLDTLASHRPVHNRKQEQNTRSNRQREQYLYKRQYYIDMYNRAREALKALGALDDAKIYEYYPPLTADDTHRSNPSSRRLPGSSRSVAGSLWHPLAVPPLPATLSRTGALQASSSATRRGLCE